MRYKDSFCMGCILIILACLLLEVGAGTSEAKASPARAIPGEMQPDAPGIRTVSSTHAPQRSFAIFGDRIVIKAASKNNEGLSDEYFISRNTEAVQLHSEGRVSEAEELLRLVLNEAVAARGVDDKYTVLTMLNLAEICIYQKQNRDAIELLEAVGSSYQKHIGRDHSKTADLIARLASVHLSLGQIEEAKPLLEEVLRVRRKSLGAMHPNSLTALDALGGINYSLGRFKEAQRLYAEALDGFEKTIGAMHEQTQQTRRNLTQVLSHLE